MNASLRHKSDFAAEDDVSNDQDGDAIVSATANSKHMPTSDTHSKLLERMNSLRNNLREDKKPATVNAKTMKSDSRGDLLRMRSGSHGSRNPTIQSSQKVAKPSSVSGSRFKQIDIPEDHMVQQRPSTHILMHPSEPHAFQSEHHAYRKAQAISDFKRVQPTSYGSEVYEVASQPVSRSKRDKV